MREKKALFHVLLIVSAFVVFCVYSVFCLSISSKPFLCTGDVVSIEGFLVFDSSYSSNGNHLMTVFVEGAQNAYGNKVSSRGNLTVVSKEKCTVSCGETIKAYGKVSDSLFICESFEVTKKPVICHLRQFLIQALEKRLLGKGAGEASFLSSALILGRAEDSQLKVKSLAQSCGCLHILALSGMHLNVLKKFCEKLFGKKKEGKVVSFLIVTLFVFVAGPRPSLIRALLMFYLSFLPLDERLCCAFLLQVFLFPLTVINIGTLYGYASVFAIVFLSPYLSEVLKNLLPSPLAKILGPTLSAVLVSSPINLIRDGFWYPVSIIVSPLCTALIGLSMAEGFAGFFLSRFSIYRSTADFSYRVLETVLLYFSKFKPGGLIWYLVFVLAVLILFVFAIIRRRYVSSHLLSSFQVI